MLQVTIPGEEFFNEADSTFLYGKECTIQIEHSLVSMSKWESKWCKPFLSTEHTGEEILDYIKCMTITQNVDQSVYTRIPQKVFVQIDEYIHAKMTATWFNDRDQGAKSREVITSELIYYWMIAQQIPFECQKWHLNRLLTLIRVCNVKSQPKKKMGRKEMLNQRAALNAARKKSLNTNG